MTAIEDRTVGRCGQCNKPLLLGQSGLCICCENVFLLAEIAARDATIEQMKKKKQGMYAALIEARKASEA